MQHQLHLTDEELLLAIDREIPAARHTRAAAHLARCADCREKQAQLDGAAGRFTAQYREEGASTGREDEARSRLRSQMHAIAAERSEPGYRRLLAGFLATPRWVAIGAAVAAVVLVFRLGMPSSDGGSRGAMVRLGQEALPVAMLTPGATWNVSLAELCAGGARAREQRPIPVSVRQGVLREYRMSDAPADSYELDYLITPELGGAPDARNLWPQRYAAGIWNARVKDDLERLLPRLVCNGRVNLQAAQRDIAHDWIAAYKKYFATDTPLPSWARLTTEDEAGEPDDITYPVWRSANAPALTLVSFPVRR